MPLEVVLYRYYNRNGTSKDWVYPMAVTRTDAELIVYYGRTGSLLRHAVTPAAQCRAHDPRAEAEHRAEEKVRKGYIYQGRYQLSDNRRELWPLTEATPRVSSSTMAAATETETTPCWYWLNRIPSDPGPVADEVETARMVVIDVLDYAALPIPDTPDQRDLVKGLVEGKEATGCVELTTDNAPFVAFMLLLARHKQAGFRVATEAGQLVTGWPDEIPIAVEVLEKLGLKPRNLNRLLATTSDGDNWFC